jgi:PncC family amidohydrolase
MKPSDLVSRNAAQYLKQQGLVVVTAESCTAGLIASRLAEVPGAGGILEGAFVVYDPKAKQRYLGVRKETMDRYNLTSEEVALEMARGALAHSDANVAIANTGVTDDADPAIRPGTQCFAWVFRTGPLTQEAFTETKVFEGSRNAIREASAGYALQRVVDLHRSMRNARNQRARARPELESYSA